MAETVLLTVVVTAGDSARCVDLAVASDIPLGDLVAEFLDAAGIRTAAPPRAWSVRDGGRTLRTDGGSLTEQGVVSGSVLRLEQRAPSG